MVIVQVQRESGDTDRPISGAGKSEREDQDEQKRQMEDYLCYRL